MPCRWSGAIKGLRPTIIPANAGASELLPIWIFRHGGGDGRLHASDRTAAAIAAGRGRRLAGRRHWRFLGSFDGTWGGCRGRMRDMVAGMLVELEEGDLL